MSEEDSLNKSKEVASKPKSGTLSVIILLLSVVAFAIALVLVVNKGAEIQSGAAADSTSVKSSGLTQNKEYMIYVRKIEVSPKKADGKAWDINGSAPDIFYKMTWKGNQIFESDVKKDSLITEWIPIGIDLKESILKGGVSIDQALQLPIVKWSGDDESDKLVFEVFDKDIGVSDPIETLTYYISDLKAGRNIKTFTDKPGFGLLKIDLHVLDNSLSQSDKIQVLMGGQ